ncbi:hypothetical protein EVAR_21736_1 [Eumeta japonica]|uniref:Uncharacterized protein n=1 Tax=Eumeta variegata TaxID=151549 RepID=A0A4C1W6Q2_EUMVA|nr:hypothetical protein EVAR_21736_1 [Eumeta japonica]
MFCTNVRDEGARLSRRDASAASTAVATPPSRGRRDVDAIADNLFGTALRSGRDKSFLRPPLMNRRGAGAGSEPLTRKQKTRMNQCCLPLPPLRHVHSRVCAQKTVYSTPPANISSHPQLQFPFRYFFKIVQRIESITRNEITAEKVVTRYKRLGNSFYVYAGKPADERRGEGRDGERVNAELICPVSGSAFKRSGKGLSVFVTLRNTNRTIQRRIRSKGHKQWQSARQLKVFGRFYVNARLTRRPAGAAPAPARGHHALRF